MPRYKNGTPTLQQRVLAALRVDAREGNGPQTVAQLHTRPGLTRRRSSDIEVACRLLALTGDLYQELIEIGRTIKRAYSIRS